MVRSCEKWIGREELTVAVEYSVVLVVVVTCCLKLATFFNFMLGSRTDTVCETVSVSVVRDVSIDVNVVVVGTCCLLDFARYNKVELANAHRHCITDCLGVRFRLYLGRSRRLWDLDYISN